MTHELTTGKKKNRKKERKKIVILKCCLLILFNDNEPFLYWIMMWWKVDFMWQPVMTSSVFGLRSSKALPKAKLAPHPTKKRSWLLYGSLLPVWSTTSFWILVNPLYLRSMLNKWMKRTEKCNTYWLHWSMGPKFSMTIPNHVTQTKLQKLNKLGYRVFPYPPYSTDSHQSTTMSLSILTTFCSIWNMLPQPAGGLNALWEFIKL